MGAEPVFVPSENPTSEDEGYLLSFVYNQAEDKSDLIVLNAQDLRSGPVARIKLPQRVPYGFHGNWVTL
jgi:carotenoid cleavage dioxygenase